MFYSSQRSNWTWSRNHSRHHSLEPGLNCVWDFVFWSTSLTLSSSLHSFLGVHCTRACCFVQYESPKVIKSDLSRFLRSSSFSASKIFCKDSGSCRFCRFLCTANIWASNLSCKKIFFPFSALSTFCSHYQSCLRSVILFRFLKCKCFQAWLDQSCFRTPTPHRKMCPTQNRIYAKIFTTWQ